MCHDSDGLGNIQERYRRDIAPTANSTRTRGILPKCTGDKRSDCVCGLDHTPHTREFPLGLFHGRSLHVPVSSTPFPVPDYPWSSIVLPTVDDRIIVHHNSLFDLNLHTQVTSARIGFILPAVKLCPHGVRDVARSGELMADDDPLMSTLLSGVCGWGSDNQRSVDHPERTMNVNENSLTHNPHDHISKRGAAERGYGRTASQYPTPF